MFLHGVPVIVPDITQVKMNNEIHPDNPDIVLMGMLPISENKLYV